MSLPASDLSKQPDHRTTMDLGPVLPETAEVRDGRLFVGGVDLTDLARTEGTALYVFDEQHLRHQMEAYVTAFRSQYPNADIIYASKAFLNKAVVRIVEEEGLCLDVSGGGELACALSVDYPAARVFVHGNNKTPRELEEAISAGVGRIVVDSFDELDRVSKIAGEHGITQEIYLRITPGVEADTHEYIKTGCEDSKFGFTMKDGFALAAVGRALSTPNVHLVGLHCHIGSQIFKLDPFAEAAQVMVAFLDQIRTEYSATLGELDLGGGLGIAYLTDDQPASVQEFAQMLCGAVKDACGRHDFPLPRLLVEPGRSLVANAGMTLYTVGTIKELPGIRTFVAVDGGMSDNIRTALYHADYEPTLANKADQPRTQIVTLCGKHCESGDAVVLDMPLQEAEVGDIVCVFSTGAYNQTMASNYNGQPRPGVAFLRDGHAKMVTRRETYEDLYARDTL